MPRRSHDLEFKRQAVDLLIQSEKPLTQIARELGVSASSLHLWKSLRLKATKTESAPPENSSAASPEQLYQEIRRLRKENQILITQREILKKAMSILGENPQSDMP